MASPSATDKPAEGEWDAHATSYADRGTALTEPFARDLVAVVAPTLQLPTTRRVLDVACGAGAFALAYLARFPRGIAGQTVLCTDVSPTMVAAARAAVARATHGTHCRTTFEFAVEDATTLAGVADGSVQALVSVFGVFLVPDAEKTFAQIRRVLATDVPSVFATTAWTDLHPQMDLKTFGIDMEFAGMTAMKICHPELAEEPAKQETSDGDKGGADEPWHQWGKPDGAKHVVSTGGLEDARVWRSIHTLCTGDREGLWETMTTATPMVDLSSRSESEIAEMKQRYFDAIASPDRADDDAIFIVAAANIVTARPGK